MYGYATEEGYMGNVNGEFILFVSDEEYRDYLLFDSSVEVKSGDIVDATVNSDHMCRRYIFRDGKHIFRREDGLTCDVIPDDFIIHGVMISLIRNYRRSEYTGDPDI